MNESRVALLKTARHWVESGEFASDLGALVAIPTESQNPASGAELHHYLREAMPGLLPDWQLEIIENPVKDGPPFLIAKLIEDAALPTVLTYGHGDVVWGQAGEWQENRDPFAVTQAGDRLYGRGTADNKSQHLINLKTLELLRKSRGKLGFNVTLLLEMGEESGSLGLEELVRARKEDLKADIFIASDGPRLSPDVPTLFGGSRGAMNFALSVTFRKRAHHSGNWGGLLADPAQRLAHALATIANPSGEIRVPAWQTATPDGTTREALKNLPVGTGGPSLSPGWGGDKLSAAEKVFAANAFAVLALECGHPEAPQNAINPFARAFCQLRFVTETAPKDILPGLRQHLDKHGFADVKIEGEPTHFAPATQLDPNHPMMLKVARSVKRTVGVQPHVTPNLGGYIPNHVFSDILGLPTIWLPHSYGGCNQHAPDEHVLLPVITSAAEVMAGLWWDIAAGEVL